LNDITVYIGFSSYVLLKLPALLRFMFGFFSFIGLELSCGLWFGFSQCYSERFSPCNIIDA